MLNFISHLPRWKSFEISKASTHSKAADHQRPAIFNRDIPNTTVKNGVTYYLKKVEIIEGFYRATFEGWIN